MFASWSQTLDRQPADLCRQGFGTCAARFIDNFSFGQLQLETPISKTLEKLITPPWEKTTEFTNEPKT